MSNKLAKNNQQQTPAPETKAPETPKPTPAKKPGLFKRIGNWFATFKDRHPVLAKVGKVTWGVTKVIAVGAVLAKAAYEIFGPKTYVDVPIDVPFKEVPDAATDAVQQISEQDHSQLTETVLNALPENFEVEKVTEF